MSVKIKNLFEPIPPVSFQRVGKRTFCYDGQSRKQRGVYLPGG